MHYCGDFSFRKNRNHLAEFSHPGDSDYHSEEEEEEEEENGKEEEEEEKESGGEEEEEEVPECPQGEKCMK